jgi:hypothetical protein
VVVECGSPPVFLVPVSLGVVPAGEELSAVQIQIRLLDGQQFAHPKTSLDGPRMGTTNPQGRSPCGYPRHLLTELPARTAGADLADLLPNRWALSTAGPVAVERATDPREHRPAGR